MSEGQKQTMLIEMEDFLDALAFLVKAQTGELTPEEMEELRDIWNGPFVHQAQLKLDTFACKIGERIAKQVLTGGK